MKIKLNNLVIFTVAFGLLIIIFSVLLMAAVPPVSRDALTQHLAIPKLWIERGSIHPIPSLPISFYPMNLELLYLIPMWFGNDIIPKYIHFLFALATAWMIYSYLGKRTTRTLSLLGALLFLSTPIIVKLSTTAYVDLGLIFFSWASIYQLLNWSRCRQSLKHIVLSGIFCGLCLGTKYNGLIVLCLLTLFIPVIYIRTAGKNNYKVKRAIGYSALFSLISLGVFSPWMIRNYRLTGNPVYPLYNKVINGESNESQISNMSMKPWLQRKLIYKESFLETLLIPVRIFFQGKDDNPRYFDGRLNPMLILFPLILFLLRRNHDRLQTEQLFLFSFAVLFIFYASFMVDMRIRYIAPAIPPLVVLTVFGIKELIEWINSIASIRIRGVSRCMLFSTVIFFITLNISYATKLFTKVNPVPYVLGKISREDYLKNNLPDFQAINFVNHIKDDNSKILALFLGKRLYYFDKPVVFGSQTFKRIVDGATSDKTIEAYLRGNGFTHCIIGIDYFRNWANMVFTGKQKKIVSEWLRNGCRLLFSKNGYAVFQLIN